MARPDINTGTSTSAGVSGLQNSAGLIRLSPIHRAPFNSPVIHHRANAGKGIGGQTGQRMGQRINEFRWPKAIRLFVGEAIR